MVEVPGGSAVGGRSNHDRRTTPFFLEGRLEKAERRAIREKTRSPRMARLPSLSHSYLLVVHSPEFKCFGHTWGITVYPGGHRKAKNGWVSVSINNLSDEKITIDYDIAVLYADDKVLCMKRAKKRVFDSADTNSWGDKNLVSRATLVEKQSKYLDNGALKIQVMMRLSGGCYHNRIRQHVPDNNYLGVKGDDETSDVAFDLQGGNYGSPQVHYQIQCQRLLCDVRGI